MTEARGWLLLYLFAFIMGLCGASKIKTGYTIRDGHILFSDLHSTLKDYACADYGLNMDFDFKQRFEWESFLVPGYFGLLAGCAIGHVWHVRNDDTW